MKKKLEADLISIAHRILKLKNKSELVQLHLETQKLYEKLSVLLFVEENFAEVKPTIGYSDIKKQLEATFEKEEKVTLEEPIYKEPTVTSTAIEQTEVEPATVQDEVYSAAEIADAPIADEEELPIKQQTVETVVEEEPEVETVSEPEAVSQEPEAIVQEATTITPEPENVEKEVSNDSFFEIAKEQADAEVFEESFVPKQEMRQITLEDLLGNVQPEPIFVRAEQVDRTETITTTTNVDEPDTVSKVEVIHTTKTEVVIDPKPSSLNDLLSKTITIGLNDRIGFEKHLFAGSGEDLNRVLSQLSTFNTFQEAYDFIEDMVKPDYNNWDGKDDYSKRFMEIVEKRFS